MLGKIISWIKQNKLTAVLLLIVAYFLFRNTNVNPLRYSESLTLPTSYQTNEYAGEFASPPSLKSMALPRAGGGSYSEAAPAPDVENRMVVEISHLSLLVKNVNQTLKAIKDRTSSLGGYMVNSNLSNPQDAATGDITLRVPASKLDEVLSYCRSLAVKVTSERLEGRDVTDEYVDIDAKLITLLANKKRFEEIMDKAEKIEDILRIQQQIFSLQDQIDGLHGRQNYLEQTAKMAKITIYLSTDEFALPFAPAQSWRPNVIFKRAVRSLVSNLQNLGSLAIWLSVYSLIWIPILLIVTYLRRRKSAREI